MRTCLQWRDWQNYQQWVLCSVYTVTWLTKLPAVSAVFCVHSDVYTMTWLTKLPAVSAVFCVHSDVYTVRWLTKLPAVSAVFCVHSDVYTVTWLTKLPAVSAVFCVHRYSVTACASTIVPGSHTTAANDKGSKGQRSSTAKWKPTLRTDLDQDHLEKLQRRKGDS